MSEKLMILCDNELHSMIKFSLMFWSKLVKLKEIRYHDMFMKLVTLEYWVQTQLVSIKNYMDNRK